MLGVRGYRPNRSGQVERTIARVFLVFGLAAAGGLWYLTRRAGEGTSLFLPGVVGLAVMGGVTWFGRVRTRERWEAAWDSYTTDEMEVDPLDPAEEEHAELCAAGGR